MPAQTFTVARMQRAYQPAVVSALTRAFFGDPLLSFFLPNEVHEIRGTLAFMSSAVTDASPFDEIWVARNRGEVAGVAVWLPPEGYPRSRQRDLMTLVRTSRAFTHSGRRILGGVRLLNETEKAHHELREQHFYLAVLGTDPLHRGTGAGSAVLQPALDTCDQRGLPAYLETQREENLAYYARHGFEVGRKVEVKGVPPMWTMTRTPR